MSLSLLMLLWMTFVPGQAHRKPAPPPVHPKPFTTDLTLEQMAHKQAVIQTAFGPIVIDLRPDLAPNHVGYFM
ncbi:MAG TPA: hypothetical protein VG871_02800, partial [Vicinamibacterales bacterium]|nr:hypothetical protein [Vicinamibacterales bacterium]